MAEPSISHTPPPWLLPITETQPCGPSLEYDADYAVLVARMQKRGEAQYGRFIDAEDPTDWPEVERQCHELLVRTRDINVFVWLCRARVRATQAAGLVQGLGMLADVLDEWPEHVHPQVMIDGEPDLAVRVNALAALCDPEGLLGDIREMPVSNNALRLLVRDVERAFATAGRGNSTPPQLEAVRQQLLALRERSMGQASAPINLLAQAAQSASRIQHWCSTHLQDQAPALQALLRLLQPFEVQAAATSPSDAGAEPADREPMQPSVEAYVPSFGRQSALQGRAQAQRSIRDARHWFELNEPSSPVAVLLKRAECLVGRRFAEVADAIPLDLLQKWDAVEAQEISNL